MASLAIKTFLKSESAGGIILLIALAFVLIVANSPLDPYYEKIIHASIPIQINGFVSIQSLFSIINDGLMTLFFLLLALEIKREMVAGELHNPKQVILPIIAACGGVIAPAVIYLSLVGMHDPVLVRGWAVPIATDVALALGLLALLGSRVPHSLKIFLAVLAIADDLIAIAIIAVFYTEHLAYLYLALSLLGVGLLVLLNILGVTRNSIYMVIGVFIWLAALKSGIHATLAGVAVGFCIPFTSKHKEHVSPLLSLENNLRPWVAFGVLPLFVLVNAGVSVAENEFALTHPMPLGIALGLFFGKQIGIFAAAGLLIKSGLARLPNNSSWLQLYGIAILAGIGFTMSIFISNLAFRGTTFDTLSHLGILAGSTLSAVVGLLVLYFASRYKRAAIGQ